MNRFQRAIGFFDAHIVAASNTFDAPPTISTGRALQLIRAIPEAERYKKYSNGDEIFYIRDWYQDGDDHHILVNKSDRLLSDPRFSNPLAHSWRTVPRRPDEGLDFSCHVLIRANDDPLGQAQTLIENATGLTVSAIQRFFNALMRDAADIDPGAFTFNHPDGLKTYKTRFMFRFDGHPADDLIHDLEAGSIAGIELITARDEDAALDTHGYVREVKKSLQVRLANVVQRGTRVATLRNFLNGRSRNFEQARIRFTSEDGQTRQVTVNTGDFSVGMDTVFVKRMIIKDFATPLEQSYTKLDAEIIRKMRQLVGLQNVHLPPSAPVLLLDDQVQQEGAA